MTQSAATTTHTPMKEDAAEIANLRAELEEVKAERDTARAETAMAFEVAAEAAYQRWYDEDAQELRETVRSLTPAHATAALADRDKSTREQALREAAHLVECDGDGLGGKAGVAKAILALI